jgi:geranylgeranyl pyrophosphate synthase
VRVLGIDRARAEAERLAQNAVNHLEQAGIPAAALAALAGYIASRNS